MYPKHLLYFIGLGLLLIFFSRCAEDLERFDLPANLLVRMNVEGVNNVKLEAELKNLGSFEIVDQGFLFAYFSFECKDPVTIISDIDITVDTEQDFVFEAIYSGLDLGREFHVRAFVEILNPTTKERRRICSEIPSTGLTGNLSLRGAAIELVDKSIQLSGRLNGLEDSAFVQDHGFFWVISKSRLGEFPDPVEIYDTVNTQIVSLGPLDGDSEFKIKRNFQFGTYYYAMPYVLFKDKLIFDVEGYQEIFIGDFWIELENDTMTPGLYPEYLADGVSFVIDDYAYIGTGDKISRIDDSRYITATFWRYDPVNNSYEQRAVYPGSEEGRRLQAVGFALNGKGYLGTGHNRVVQFSEFYEYTPETDKWRRVRDFPKPIRSAVSFVIDDFAYVGTGWSCEDQDGNGIIDVCRFVSDLYRFDPTDTTEVDSQGRPMGKWEKMASLPQGTNRRSAVGFALNGLGYIATGVASNGHSRGVYAYDPINNSWERKKDLPAVPRQKAIAFTLGNRAYIAAGTNSDLGGAFPTLRDLWVYFPETNSWLQRADLALNNMDSGLPFTFRGKAYVYGGFIAESFESISHYVRVYTPEKDVFESAQ